MDAGSILHARHGSTCVLKLVGEIRYNLGYSFSAYLEQLFRKADFDDILVDLTEASCIDSTCLGLLAKVANFTRERFDRKPILFSTRADITEVLDCIGFDQAFTICDKAEALGEDIHEIASSNPGSERDLAQTVLEAHRILCEMNDANRAQFKDVVEAIRADLEQNTAGGR